MTESEVCIRCGGTLPPLDGTEENDFAVTCLECEWSWGDKDSHDDDYDFAMKGEEWGDD